MYGMCQNGMHCAGNRAHAEQISGDLMQAASHLSDDSVDAFISTYVLDILSDKDIDAVLRLAHRYFLTGKKYCRICCQDACHTRCLKSYNKLRRFLAVHRDAVRWVPAG